MPGEQHFLEIVSDGLAAGIGETIDALTYALQAPGGRPPFTTRKPKREALAWWRANWNTEPAQRALKLLSPTDVLNLQVALANNNEPAMPEEATDGSW